VKTILGRVVLLGVVGNRGDIKRAVDHARKVEQVKEVKAFIMVHGK